VIARTYYHRRFGEVRPAASIQASAAVFVFITVFVLAESLQIDPATVPVPAIIVALGLGYVGLAGGRARPHYLTMAALVALFTMLGPLGVPRHTRDVLFDQLVGIGFIVIGAGDHLLLRDTLVPVTRADAV
jgi:hypothetical protein